MKKYTKNASLVRIECSWLYLKEIKNYIHQHFRTIKENQTKTAWRKGELQRPFNYLQSMPDSPSWLCQAPCFWCQFSTDLKKAICVPWDFSFTGKTPLLSMTLYMASSDILLTNHHDQSPPGIPLFFSISLYL